MASRDSDLDRLSSLLGQCLGRIDEEAYRLQRDETDFDQAERLEDQTAELQGLIDSLLVVDMGADEVELNDVVSRVAESFLQQLNVPIVLRQSLTTESTLVAAEASLVNVAVQRAMVLAVEPLGPGDELALTTRIESGSVVFEIESHGSQSECSLDERGETLRDFLQGFGGNCQLRTENLDHFMVIELPQVMATDRSESV